MFDVDPAWRERCFRLLLKQCVAILLSCLVTSGIVIAASAQSSSTNRQYNADKALRVSQAAIGRTLGDYALIDADGKRLRLSQFRGRPLVISMIYTSCHHICPTTTIYLARVVRIAREALGTDSFSVITIGFDVHKDTPAAMRAFARKQGVNIKGWHFLSTDQQTIKHLARDLGFQFYTSPKGFDHLVQATVIDQQGKIYRQVYGTRFDTPLLVEPLKQLVFGRPAKHSLLTTIGNKIRLFCTVYDPGADRYRFDYSIFIGMFIGITTLGAVMFFVIREWRRLRQQRL